MPGEFLLQCLKSDWKRPAGRRHVKQHLLTGHNEKRPIIW